jgi:hypothetical protein
MKIKLDYLYRVLPHLEKDGKVEKRTRATTQPTPEREPDRAERTCRVWVALGARMHRNCRAERSIVEQSLTRREFARARNAAFYLQMQKNR